MESPGWNLRGGISEVESQRWNLRGGISEVESQRWNLRGGISEVESQRWNLRPNCKKINSSAGDTFHKQLHIKTLQKHHPANLQKSKQFGRKTTQYPKPVRF